MPRGPLTPPQTPFRCPVPFFPQPLPSYYERLRIFTPVYYYAGRCHLAGSSSLRCTSVTSTHSISLPVPPPLPDLPHTGAGAINGTYYVTGNENLPTDNRGDGGLRYHLSLYKPGMTCLAV